MASLSMRRQFFCNLQHLFGIVSLSEVEHCHPTLVPRLPVKPRFALVQDHPRFYMKIHWWVLQQLLDTGDVAMMDRPMESRATAWVDQRSIGGTFQQNLSTKIILSSHSVDFPDHLNACRVIAQDSVHKRSSSKSISQVNIAEIYGSQLCKTWALVLYLLHHSNHLQHLL